MLKPDTPALVLAPMQGVTDAPMCAVQGSTGAFTFAVTEFVRVSQVVPSKSVFYRYVPELRAGGLTPTGLPVQVQLLGGDASRMAAAAVVAAELGAAAIDINFGCPAPTVNRHDGGAVLLRYPKRIREIVSAIRAALPATVPVSAKLRLGWDRPDSIHENAEMAAAGGAAWLTIHGRTRLAGYNPPAYWEPIGRVREQLGIPVVANGDIWTVADFYRCREESGCRHFMLGRGALADPLLAGRVAAELGIGNVQPNGVVNWVTQLEQLVERSRGMDEDRPARLVHRLKQWMNLAAKFGNFTRFDSVKRANSVEEFFEGLRNSN